MKKLLLFSALMPLLFACGNNDEDTGESSEQTESPQEESDEIEEINENLSPEVPISKAFDEHAVWFYTSSNPARSVPERDTDIWQIFVFNDGMVTHFPIWDLGLNEDANNKQITYEDILDLSDEEIVRMAEEARERVAVSRFEKGFENSDILEDALNADLTTDYPIDIKLDGSGNSVDSYSINYLSYLYWQDADSYESFYNRYQTDGITEEFSLSFRQEGGNYQIYDQHFANVGPLFTRVDSSEHRFFRDSNPREISHPNVTIEGEPTQ